MEINFIGGAYLGRSRTITAQECENLMPVTDRTGGATVLALIGTPGSKLFFSSGAAGEVRAVAEWKGHLYALVGATLWKINPAGAGTNVGTVSNSSGAAWIAGGITYLAVSDGATGYYQTEGATSLTTITDADYPAAVSSLVYQSGYFIATEADTDLFWVSAYEDPSSWAGLDFASAEEQPDDAQVGISHGREYWVIGTRTAQAFADSGNTAFPITPIAGSISSLGTDAPRSVAAGPEGLFFLSHTGSVVARNGYQFSPVSTEAVDYQIGQYGDTSDAVGYVYSQEGHSFYAITFPGAGASKTWVYDVTTGLWHTRSTGVYRRRHRAQCAVNVFGKALIGDYQDGNIYELDLGTYTDAGETIVAVRACQPVHSGRQLVVFHALELEFEAGIGLATGQGSDPQAALQWSNDGGKTWSSERLADIGEIGKYGTRAIWRQLGSGRQRVFRVTITDPVKRVIVGAHLRATVANS